jgi:hypothetical protein
MAHSRSELRADHISTPAARDAHRLPDSLEKKMASSACRMTMADPA